VSRTISPPPLRAALLPLPGRCKPTSARTDAAGQQARRIGTPRNQHNPKGDLRFNLAQPVPFIGVPADPLQIVLAGLDLNELNLSGVAM